MSLHSVMHSEVLGRKRGFGTNDVITYRVVNELQDCEQLQMNLKNVARWTADNGMMVNGMKSQALSFTKRKNPNMHRGQSNSHALNTFLQNVLRARQELLWLKNSSMQFPDQQLYTSPRKRALKEYPSRQSIKSVDITNGKYDKEYSSDPIRKEYSSISEEEDPNSDEDVLYGTSSNNLQYVPKQVFDEHLKSGIRNQRNSSYNELREDYDDQEPVFTEEKFDRNNRRKRSALKKKKKRKRKKKKRRLKPHKSNVDIVRPRDINIDASDARGNWTSSPIEHTINETSRISPHINYYNFQPEKSSAFQEYSDKMQPRNFQLNSTALESTLYPETFFAYNEDSFTPSISPIENSFHISFPQESNMLSRSGVSLRSSNSEFPTYINQSLSNNILPIENSGQNDSLSSHTNEIMVSASNSTLHKSSVSGNTKLDSTSSYDTIFPSEGLQNNAMTNQQSTKILSSDNIFNNTSDTLLGNDVKKSPIENLNIPHNGTNSFSLASIPSHPLLMDSSADNSNNILAGNVLNTFPSLDSINNNLSNMNASISSELNNTTQLNKIHSPLDNISSDISPKKSYTLETVHTNLSNNSAATDSLNLSLFNDIKLTGKENNLASIKPVEPLTKKFQTSNTPKGQNEASIKLGKVLENLSQIKNDKDIAISTESKTKLEGDSNPDSQANNGYININNKEALMTSSNDFEINIGSRSIKQSDKEVNTFFDEQDDSDDKIYMDVISNKADTNRDSRESVTSSENPEQAKLNFEYKTIPSCMETVPETSNPLVSNVELSNYDIKYKVADKSPETDSSENLESYALQSKTSQDASYEALSSGSDIFPKVNNLVQRNEDNNHDTSKLVIKRSITSGSSMEMSELVTDDQDSQLSPLFENILLKKLNASRSENESIDFVGKFHSKAECDREKKRKEQELESNLKNLIDVNSKFVYTNHNVEENVALSDDPVSLINSIDISYMTTKSSLSSPDSQKSEDKAKYIFREIRSVRDSTRENKKLEAVNFAENTDGKVEISTRSIVQQTSSDTQYFQEIQKLFGHEETDHNTGLEATKSAEGDPKLNIRRSHGYDNHYLNPGSIGRRINEGYYLPEEKFQTAERSTFSGLGISMDNEGEPGQRKFENIYFTARIFSPGVYTLKPEWDNISNISGIGGFKKTNFYDETLNPSEIPESKGVNLYSGYNNMNEIGKLGPQMLSGFNDYSTGSLPARDFTTDGIYDTDKTTAYQPLFQNLMNSPSNFEYHNPVSNMTMSSLSAGFGSEVLMANAGRNTVSDFEPYQELPIFGSYDSVRENELKNIISKDIKMSSFVSPPTFNMDQNDPSREYDIKVNYGEKKVQRNYVPLNSDQQTTIFSSVTEKIYESQNQNHDQNMINSIQSKSYNSLTPNNGGFSSENVQDSNFNSIQKSDNTMYHNQEDPIINNTTGKIYGSKNQNQQEHIIDDTEPKHFSQIPSNERTNSQIVKSEKYEPQNQNPSNFGPRPIYREDRHQNQRIENPNISNAEKNENLDRPNQGKQIQGNNMYPIKQDDNRDQSQGREEHSRMNSVDNTGQMIHNQEERGHGNSKSEAYGSSVSLSLGKQNKNIKMEPTQDSAVVQEEKYGAMKPDQYNKQTHSNVKSNIYNDPRNQNRGNEKPFQNSQSVFENQRKPPSNIQEFDKSYDSTNRGQDQFPFNNVKGEKNRVPLPQSEERGNVEVMKSDNYNDSGIKNIQIKHNGNTGTDPYQDNTSKRKQEFGQMKVDKNDFSIVHNKNQQPYDRVKTPEYDKPVMQNHSIENMQNQGREEHSRMKSVDNRPTGQMVYNQEDRNYGNTKSGIEKLGNAQTNKANNPANEFLEKQPQDNIKTGNRNNSQMKNEVQVHQNGGEEKVIVTVLQNKDNKPAGREMDGNNDPLKQNAKYNKETGKNGNATNIAHMMSPHEKVTGNEKIGVYSIIPVGTKSPSRGSNDDKAAMRVHKIPPKHGGAYPMKTENATKKKLTSTKEVFERVNNNYGTSNSSPQTLLEKHLHLQKQMVNPRKELHSTTEKGKQYDYEMQAQDGMRNNEEQHGSNRKEQEEKKEQAVHQGPPDELVSKEATQNLGAEDHKSPPATIVKSDSHAGMKDHVSNQETNIVETKGRESKVLQLSNSKQNLENDHKNALLRSGPSSDVSITNNPEDHKSRPHNTESMKTDNRNMLIEDGIGREEYEIPRVSKGNNIMIGEEPDLMENNWFFKQGEDNGESSFSLLDAVTTQNRQDIIQEGNSHRRELRNALDSSVLQANDKTDEDHSKELMPNFISASGNIISTVKTRDILQSSHFPEEHPHLSQHGRFSRDAHDKGRKPSEKGVYTPIEHHDDSFPNFLTIPKRPVHYQPSHEEDESQLQEAMSGDLARKIVDAILKKEHEQGELQKHFVLSTDHAKCTDINKQRKLQEEINRHKNEEMMKRVMQILENLAQQEVKDNACTKLTPDLKSFLMWMLDKSEEDIDEGEKEGKDSFLFHQHRHGPPAHNKPPLNVHPFYTAERYNTLPPDPQSIIKKVSLLQKLIHEYENLSSKEKVKVSGIYDNLITNLNTLRNMVGLPEYHGKGSKCANMTQANGNNATQGKLAQLKDDHGHIAPNSFNVAHRTRINEFPLTGSASDKAQFVPPGGSFPTFQSSGRKAENTGKLHSLYDFSAVASPSHDYQVMLKEKADRASIRNQLESLGLSENATNTGSSFANRFLYSIGALNKESHPDYSSKFSDNNVNNFVDPASQINQAESSPDTKGFRDYRSNPLVRMDQFVNKSSLHHNGPVTYDWKSREFRQLGNNLYDDTEPVQNWKSYPGNSLSKYRHKKDNNYFLGPHRRYRRHHGAERESASISQVMNENSRNKKSSGEYSLQEKKQNHRQISSQYKRITSKKDAEQHHKRSHNSIQNQKRHKRRKKKQKH